MCLSELQGGKVTEQERALDELLRILGKLVDQVRLLNERVKRLEAGR